MKLKNVHYEYRGNDIWRIYFKDALEADAFRNEKTDEQKAQIAMLLPIFTNGKGVRYCVEAKLTGQFSFLRRYVKDSPNDYFSNDVWRALVKKIEGADSDYVFDEIDLWYDATIDKCYFRIRCMNGTWTELFVKNMLNSQFGMVAQANGYYDTDGQGGLCVRRSCCGIGFGEHRSRYGNTEERIIFTVKNFCRGEADIVKVSPWTNTFIGTNKETEKEYSWNDFKQYMQKLSSTGSDIWDIEWKYDETCLMTGTEVADKLHVYLEPLAYKRLFEEKEKKEQLLKNITDVSLCMTKVLGCGTLYYYNLYFDDKSDLKNVNDNHINRSMDNSVKGTYYIRVVSCNKELPKNISSATLVWDQEENRYSVEDFTIKGYRSEGKKVWISSNSTLWSNDGCLGRLKALTPPPVPYWFKLDDDPKIGFRQKDVDEIQKEIDEATKRIYEKLEIKQVKDFDTDTTWHEYLTATEMAKALSGADFDGDVDIAEEFIAATLKAKNSTTEPHIFFNNKVMTLTEFNEFIKETNNKEEKNMGPKDTTFAEFCRRIYWGTITPVKPTKILIQGTATIIWWSDGTKTIVKCQKGDKMDPEKGIAMCVMKKFMGTNETHSNYLDFAKDAIAEYEKQQAAEKAKKKAEADKRRRAAAKKKGTAGNANYKRGAKGKTEAKAEKEPESKEKS